MNIFAAAINATFYLQSANLSTNTQCASNWSSILLRNYYVKFQNVWRLYLRAHVQLSEVNLLKLFGSHSRPVALARKCHCLDYLLITLHPHIITDMFSEWLLNGTNRYTTKENISINETFQWNITANMEGFVGATLFISQFKFPLI